MYGIEVEGGYPGYPNCTNCDHREVIDGVPYCTATERGNIREISKMSEKLCWMIDDGCNKAPLDREENR
jgi:hypothetical protein